MTGIHIGAGLSKDWPDVYDPRRGYQGIANSGREIRGFPAGPGPRDMIVFEGEAEA